MDLLAASRGEVGLNDDVFKLEDGSTPPVLHVDSEEPLFDEDARQITPGPWGIYFKRHHKNTQGGAVPIGLGTNAEVDPYGPKSALHGRRGLCHILDGRSENFLASL